MRAHFLQKCFLFLLVQNAEFLENLINNYCIRPHLMWSSAQWVKDPHNVLQICHTTFELQCKLLHIVLHICAVLKMLISISNMGKIFEKIGKSVFSHKRDIDIPSYTILRPPLLTFIKGVLHEQPLFLGKTNRYLLSQAFPEFFFFFFFFGGGGAQKNVIKFLGKHEKWPHILSISRIGLTTPPFPGLSWESLLET